MLLRVPLERSDGEVESPRLDRDSPVDVVAPGESGAAQILGGCLGLLGKVSAPAQEALGALPAADEDRGKREQE